MEGPTMLCMLEKLAELFPNDASVSNAKNIIKQSAFYIVIFSVSATSMVSIRGPVVTFNFNFGVPSHLNPIVDKLLTEVNEELNEVIRNHINLPKKNTM